MSANECKREAPCGRDSFRTHETGFLHLLPIRAHSRAFVVAQNRRLNRLGSRFRPWPFSWAALFGFAVACGGGVGKIPRPPQPLFAPSDMECHACGSRFESLAPHPDNPSPFMQTRFVPGPSHEGCFHHWRRLHDPTGETGLVVHNRLDKPVLIEAYAPPSGKNAPMWFAGGNEHPPPAFLGPGDTGRVTEDRAQELIGWTVIVVKVEGVSEDGSYTWRIHSARKIPRRPDPEWIIE